jgi:hypothetical protein
MGKFTMRDNGSSPRYSTITATRNGAATFAKSLGIGNTEYINCDLPFSNLERNHVINQVAYSWVTVRMPPPEH